MRGRVERQGDLERALLRAVRDRDVRDATAFCGFERLQPDPSGAYDQHVPLAEVAERALGERERHRARCRRVRADRGLRARAPAGRNRAAEEKPQSRADGPRSLAGLVRLADLAEDLGFAQNEGVEPRGDPAEVARNVLAGMNVEVVEQQLARDVVRVRQRIDELVARIVDARGEPCV